MVNLENYEEYMMLYADGELTHEQEQALLAFVAEHPELQKELEAYMSTVLQPDTAMIYEGKDALMKTAGGKTVWFGGWKTYAAAACVLLAVVLFYFNRSEPNIEEHTTIASNIIDTPEHPNEATIQKPIKEDAVKLQPKTPVNTIAMETTKTPKPTNPKPVEATLPETSARQRERSATLMATAQEPVPTAKRPIDQMDAAIVQSELPAPVISSEEKKVLAMQTPFSSTRQSIALLEEAVGEKLAMAKNIKDNIKDREVTFQLGKKELFTLKL